MNEKKTVSVGFRLSSVLKSLPQSGGTTRSSPAHSKYWSAPCFIHTFLPQAASFLYAATLFLATGITNPSTYDMEICSFQWSRAGPAAFPGKLYESDRGPVFFQLRGALIVVPSLDLFDKDKDPFQVFAVGSLIQFHAERLRFLDIFASRQTL